MALDLTPTGVFAPKLRTADMDCPPSPPSPFDEITRNRQRIKHRARFLRLMKEKFPGLPY
jgi:hypothetical protein